jgi:hypothetical protein
MIRWSAPPAGIPQSAPTHYRRIGGKSRGAATTDQTNNMDQVIDGFDQARARPGSRCWSTCPLRCDASGSISGIALKPAVSPSRRKGWGTTLDQWPKRRWDQSVSSEFVSTDAWISAPGSWKMHVQNPPVLHVGRQKIERQARGLRPADGGPAAEYAVRLRHQHIVLPIQRQRADPGERFVVEIRDSDYPAPRLKGA